MVTLGLVCLCIILMYHSEDALAETHVHRQWAVAKGKNKKAVD